MALKDVANEDLGITMEAIVVPSDAVNAGEFGITKSGVTAQKDNDNEYPSGKKVCKSNVLFVWAVAGATCPFSSAALFTFVAGGGSIAATATKWDVNSMAVMRKDDEGTCAGSWILNSGPSPFPCSCKAKITKSGQSDVQTE